VDHGRDGSIEQRADQGVDGWLASLAQAGRSPAWREEQARRLGRAVRAWPARSDAASLAALRQFLTWERGEGVARER